MKNNPKDIARVNNMLTDCVELKLHDVVCIVGADVKLRPGRLADIAPTMLDLMGLEKPAEMDGTSLIEN